MMNNKKILKKIMILWISIILISCVTLKSIIHWVTFMKLLFKERESSSLKELNIRSLKKVWGSYSFIEI